MKLKLRCSITQTCKAFEIPGMPGANVGIVNIGDILGKSNGS